MLEPGAIDEPVRSFKVLMLGAAESGKSALIHRIITNEFQSAYLQTLGVDVAIKDTLDESGDHITLSFWCCSGQERVRPVVQQYYGNTQVVMLVYDITRQASFEELVYWYNEARRACRDAAMILVGCKSDLTQKQAISTEDATRQAAAWGIPQILVSCKNGDTVEALLKEISKLLSGR